MLDLLRRVDWLLELARNGPPRPENMVESATGSTSGQALTAYMQSQNSIRASHGRTSTGSARNGVDRFIIKGIATTRMRWQLSSTALMGSWSRNHGGRQLDGAVPSLEALRRVVETAGEQTTVFCDSGFRRGTDVVKALALGAKAVFLGRATVRNTGAEAGAARALEILCDEIDRTLALIGRSAVRDIDGDCGT